MWSSPVSSVKLLDQEVQDMGFSEQVMLFGLASRSLKIWALGFGVRMSSVGSGKNN